MNKIVLKDIHVAVQKGDLCIAGSNHLCKLRSVLGWLNKYGCLDHTETNGSGKGQGTASGKS